MNVKEEAQILQEFSLLSAHLFHKSKTFYLKNCYFKCASFFFVGSTWHSSVSSTLGDSSTCSLISGTPGTII